MEGNDASIKAHCIIMIVKRPAAVIYSLAEEDPVEKRRKLPRRLSSLLAVAVLVSGLAFALAGPAGPNTLENGGRVSTAMRAHPLTTNLPVAPTPTAVAPARTAPPLSLTLMLVCTGGALLLVFVVILLGFVLALDKKKVDQGKTGS